MFALVLALFVAVQSAGQAPARRGDTRTWYQAYADGKRAIDQKNWQAAIDSLEASKRARAPKPGRRIPFYGDVYDDYIPDYYLGIAYLNLKQYAQADQAFAAVRTSGLVTPKNREYAEFQRQAGAVAAGLREGQMVAQNPTPPAAGNQVPATAGNSSTASANNSVNPIAASPPPVEVATQQTNPANQQQPIVPSATARGLPAQQRPPSGVLVPGAGTAGRSSTANATVRPPASAVIQPRAEEAAIRAYLSGQYDQVAALLADSVTGARATPREYFYMACSRAALVILGQGSTTDIDEAKRLVARAGSPAQFVEDRRYVSPRILKMLGLNP
jgi:hypothetical protein